MGTTPGSVGARTFLVAFGTLGFGNSSLLFWEKQKEEIFICAFSGTSPLKVAAPGDKKK